MPVDPEVRRKARRKGRSVACANGGGAVTRRQQLSPAPAAMTSAFFVDGRSMRWMARHFKTRIAVIEYRVWLSYWEHGEERRPSRKQRAAFRARLGV